MYISTQSQNPESKNLATPCCDNLANYTDLTLVTVLLTTALVLQFVPNSDVWN
jgi:hypothetical protein